MDRFKKALLKKKKAPKIKEGESYGDLHSKYFLSNVEILRDEIVKKYNLNKIFKELESSVKDNCKTFPFYPAPKIMINDEASNYISSVKKRTGGEYIDILNDLKKLEGIHICLAQFCMVASTNWGSHLKVIILRIGVEIKDYNNSFEHYKKIEEKKLKTLISSKLIWKLITNKVNEGITDFFDNPDDLKISKNNDLDKILDEAYEFFTNYEKGGKIGLYNKILKINLADSLKASVTKIKGD